MTMEYIQKRVEDGTGVSVSTVYSVMEEYTIISAERKEKYSH